MREELQERVRAQVSPDLLRPEYVDQRHPLEGHCYVASEAFYHLTGQTLIVKQYTHEKVSHWWLETPDGEVIDLTAEQFDDFPYEKGVRRGFLTKEPSKRARILMQRVSHGPSKSTQA